MSIDPNPRQPNRRVLKVIAAAAFLAAAALIALTASGIIPIK